MRVTVTKEVTRCQDCPHFMTTMDGPTCYKLEKKYGPYKGFVFPEGRDKIHPKCPLNK